MDPLHTPIDVAGGTQPAPRGPGRRRRPGPPGRGARCHCSAPPTTRRRAWLRGVRGWAPRTPRPASDQAQEAAARALAAGACLVAVGDGTPLTRRLVCEAARLEHGAMTLLVEDGSEDSASRTRARTAVLSGRTDLVGRRQ